MHSHCTASMPVFKHGKSRVDATESKPRAHSKSGEKYKLAQTTFIAVTTVIYFNDFTSRLDIMIKTGTGLLQYDAKSLNSNQELT